jgi:hypothetical protein
MALPTPAQLTVEELRNLSAVIKHGINHLTIHGEEDVFPVTLHDHDNAGSGSLSSWKLEYSDNNRVIYKLYEKYEKEALLLTLKQVIVEFANQRFPDMCFTADRVVWNDLDRDDFYDYEDGLNRHVWGTHSMWFNSQARGNSRGQTYENSLRPDSCCIVWRSSIDEVNDLAKPLVIHIEFMNPGFTAYRLSAPMAGFELD